ncbi:hypothetical protein L2D08_22795 [Domibacillus sp. PGB-M46]|uniref:hypothetical protein n=1 Tax=Domibacillus sp. PGB-M46 TaxID=2910255 RepID=UPI001F5A8832|nr:hypothetical protein [Domibacillus sp. PGB-M46]MCI2257148.1 hypothetical protein [Domibacillus sp. PGB-M46]
MSYRRAVIKQQWTPEEVEAYCRKFEAKRPAYVREADKRVGSRFSSRGKRLINSKGNLSKAQYEKFVSKGLSDEHILAKYENLTQEILDVEKKRWKIQ